VLWDTQLFIGRVLLFTAGIETFWIEAAIKRRLISTLRIVLNISMTYCFVAATFVMQNVSLYA
jgi:hypothetical protein